MSLSAELPHIANYPILRARDAETLCAEVEAAIHNGWQPYGHLTVDRGADGAAYLQPMVLYASFHR